MAEYWNGKVCLNGHIVDYGNGENDSFCSQCGTSVLDKCSQCGSKIRGASKHWAMSTGSFTSYHAAKIENMKIPFYCPSCSNPYEWTTRILDSAVTLISLDEDIDDGVKDLIKHSIPDLLVETPATPVAIAKYKMNIKKFSKPVVDAMYQLLVDVLSDTTKKALFPDS